MQMNQVEIFCTQCVDSLKAERIACPIADFFVKRQRTVTVNLIRMTVDITRVFGRDNNAFAELVCDDIGIVFNSVGNAVNLRGKESLKRPILSFINRTLSVYLSHL